MSEKDKVGRSSFWGEVTGISPLAKAFASPLGAFKSLYAANPLGLLRALGSRRLPKVYGTPEERFASRAEQEGLSRDRINKLETILPIRAGIFGILGIAAWVNAILYFYAVYARIQQSSGFLQDLYDLMFPLVLTALSLRETIRAYQIRNRSLVSGKEFFTRVFGRQKRQTPKQKGDGPSVSLNTLLAIVVPAGLAWLLFPHVGIAQTVSGTGMIDDSTTTPQIANAYGLLSNLGAGDLSGQWLARLFPKITGQSNGDMLSDMLVTFNSVVLDFGAGIMLSQMAFGVMSAAQAGGFEQTNINPPISILRSFGGGVTLFPVHGGYCFLQIIALQMLAGGYWMADQVYDDMIQDTFSPASVSSAAANLPDGDMTTLISNVLSAETCYAWENQNGVVNEALNLSSDALSNLGFGNIFSTDQATNSNQPWSSLANIPGTQSWSVKLDMCGVLAVSSVPTITNDTGAAAIFSGASEFNINRNAAFLQFMAQVWASGLPITLMQQFTANGGVAPGQTPPAPAQSSVLQSEYKQVVTAATTYLNATQGYAQTLASSGLTAYANALSKTGNSLGWVSAGALYSTIAQSFTAATMGIDGSDPSLTVTTLQGLSQDDRVDVSDAYSEVSNFMSSMNLPTEAPLTQNGGTMAPLQPTAGVAFNDEESAQRVLNEPTAAVSFRLNNFLLMDPANPIASVMSEGENFMHAGVLGLTSIWVASKVGGPMKDVEELGATAAGGPEAGLLARALNGAIGAMTHLAFELMILLILLGAFEVYVIPMMFYIYWMFEIVQIIAFSVELVLSAPIAALLFMQINGREPVSQQQKQFFLNAFMGGVLRPSLMLFGLAISTYVLSAVSVVLNSTFNLAIASAQGSSIIGPIGIIIYVVMLVYLQWQLCVRSIHLVYTVPTTINNLVGAATHDRFAAEEMGRLVAVVSSRSNLATQKGLQAMTPTPNEPRSTGEGRDNRRDVPKS